MNISENKTKPEPLVETEFGLYKKSADETHFYHMDNQGVVLHIHVASEKLSGHTINDLSQFPFKDLYPCTKNEFETALRTAIFELNIFKFVK